jgi:hypothetical protein
MARQLKRSTDQGPGLWEVYEADQDELAKQVVRHLGVVRSTPALDEPAWVGAEFDASWPRVLAEAQAPERW